MSRSSPLGSRGWSIARLAVLGIGLTLLVRSGMAEEIGVNPEAEGYDSRASLSVGPDGGIWIAWHAYHRGHDRVLARHIRQGEPGPVCEVSQEGRVHEAPTVVADGPGSAWVVWSARQEHRWRILARRVVGQEWGPVETVSEGSGDAIFPSAFSLDDGRMLVAWSAHQNGRFRLFSRLHANGAWNPPVAVSDNTHDAFRSAIAVDGRRRVWVVWDTYQDDHYAIRTRAILPDLQPIEQVSPPGENCLVPVALSPESGPLAAVGSPWVAWLQVDDVIGGAGAITQWHTLHVATREEPRGGGRGAWRLLADASGSSAAATLTHGLIARIEPKPVATGGYLGCRRHPTLLADGESVWLLWERKADHRASTPNALGELVGRRFEKGTWDDPVVLHKGRVDYHLASPEVTRGGKCLFVASDLPRKGHRIYHLSAVDVKRPAEFRQEAWPGWKPVKLPLEREQQERHEIRVGDKTYQLYWGDLHCHSGLTADAEGEPDELLHYARDRARLDVVVMTQNDHIYDSFLTEGEFGLDHFFSAAFTRPGRFLVLPGYEWTSRVPKRPGVARSDPANWTSPYNGISYANHRSVIFPPEGGPVVRYPEVENDIRTLHDAVLEAGGITLTQHPSWDLTGHPAEVGVEVTTGWGIYIKNPDRVHRALDAGFRIGLVGNGDSHRRNPGLCGGLTAIYAESLTSQAVLDALGSRRVYATNGSRIVIDSRANGTLMGSETRADDGRATITLAIAAARPIARATLIRDGKEVRTLACGGAKRFSAVHADEDLPPGTHWYYWRIALEGALPSYPGNVKVARGNLAWSSPHWVVVP